MEGHGKDTLSSTLVFFHLSEFFFFAGPCSNFHWPLAGESRPALSVLLNTDKGLNPFLSLFPAETIAEVDNLVLQN